MRRPGWVRLSIAVLAFWSALGGAAGLPACPMVGPAAMAGMAMPGGSMAMAPGAGEVHAAARAPGAKARGAVAGASRGQVEGTAVPAHAPPPSPRSRPAQGQAHAQGCACPAACSLTGASLSGRVRVALAGAPPRLPRPDRRATDGFVPQRLLSHFLPLPAGPPLAA